MHIPDGFIDGKTAAATALLSAAGVGLALRQVRRRLPPRRVPLLGLAAAFLFAAQMVNFPVAAGVSGHLIGGVLVAALLGGRRLAGRDRCWTPPAEQVWGDLALIGLGVGVGLALGGPAVLVFGVLV